MNVDTLVAGDTLDFTRSFDGYPPADGWALRYRLVPQAPNSAGAQNVNFDAAVEDDHYRAQVGPATTGAWTPADYKWFAIVEKSGARYTVDEGFVTVEPDPEQLAPGYDGRSQARKAVDDLEAALATYSATNGHVKSYSIANRTMTFKDDGGIKDLLGYWQGKLAQEERALSIAKGQGDPYRQTIRFG